MKGIDLNELRLAKDFDKIHNKTVKWVIHDNFQRGNFSQDDMIFLGWSGQRVVYRSCSKVWKPNCKKSWLNWLVNTPKIFYITNWGRLSGCSLIREYKFTCFELQLNFLFFFSIFYSGQDNQTELDEILGDLEKLWDIINNFKPWWTHRSPIPSEEYRTLVGSHIPSIAVNGLTNDFIYVRYYSLGIYTHNGKMESQSTLCHKWIECVWERSMCGLNVSNRPFVN